MDRPAPLGRLPLSEQYGQRVGKGPKKSKTKYQVVVNVPVLPALLQSMLQSALQHPHPPPAGEHGLAATGHSYSCSYINWHG